MIQSDLAKNPGPWFTRDQRQGGGALDERVVGSQFTVRVLVYKMGDGQRGMIKR